MLAAPALLLLPLLASIHWTAPADAQVLAYSYDGSGATVKFEVSGGEAPVTVATWTPDALGQAADIHFHIVGVDWREISM